LDLAVKWTGLKRSRRYSACLGTSEATFLKMWLSLFPLIMLGANLPDIWLEIDKDKTNLMDLRRA
jgi:hypothetical protein